MSAMVNDVRPAVVRISSSGGTGTGVIYDTEGQTAYIITNQHVVEGQALVNVTVRDSATYEGTVLGVNDVRDLAVVRICCGSFQSLTFGDVDSLEAGTEIVAIGYALDIEGPATVTKGIVSAVRFNRSYGAQVIQTDAPINPGNSGGPLLSLDGKVLGINTFKLVETDVEGVGFAISALSVQESLPALRVGTPPPTPTADLRLLTPTPRPFGAETWGPLSGELEHDPTDGFIKTDYARVSLSDMMVQATFANPYSTSTGSWDYGFIFRQNRDDPFLQFVVSSDRRWAVIAGTNAPYDRLGGGTVNGLDTSPAGLNHLMVVVIEERGWFFVNGDFVGNVDLGSVTHTGDVAVITGAFEGDEVAGAVTRYEDFTGRQLVRRYGPADGELEKQSGFVGEHSSRVRTRDLVADAEFINPSGSDWSYGFIIRTPDFNRLEVIGYSGEEWWFHYTRDVGDEDYTLLADGFFTGSAGSGDRNRLVLIAVEDRGWFFIDGQLVTDISLSHNGDQGDVSVMGDFFNDHQGEPEFEDFIVWVP